ncbi:MAG: ATP-binding protein [Bacteroidota bacterium]
MADKALFESFSLKDIEELVENKVTEDLNWEFKTANFPEKTKDDFDYKNFSKCLSGFANSQGGIIVWGVKASTNKEGIDVAHTLKPIKEVVKFENYLKRNEGRAIVPSVLGIEYKTLIKEGNEGYLLIYVPESDRAPIMAQHDKHYYKRSGDSFYICEHFDIVDIFNRKTSPQLEVTLTKESFNIFDNEMYVGFVTIKNIGSVSAKYIELSLNVNRPYQFSIYGLIGNPNTQGIKLISKQDIRKYSGGTDLVIHPDMEHEVDRLFLNEMTTSNEIGTDFILNYKIVAEGMKIKEGVIKRTKSDLQNLNNV